MDINVIIASTIGLFVITLLLVTMLLVAKEKLLPSGPVKLVINGEKDVEVSSGDTLLTTLGSNKIFLFLEVCPYESCLFSIRTPNLLWLLLYFHL